MYLNYLSINKLVTEVADINDLSAWDNLLKNALKND
jgi:hypothetical protein